MVSETANAPLDAIEADNCAILYKARWDPATAIEVVPKLVAIIDSDDRDTLLRGLRALVIVGPPASEAAPNIARLLHSSEIWVVQAAAIALARVSLKNPQNAIKPLVDAANIPGGEKHVMHALIDLGEAAKSASAVFVRAVESRSASIRRLALRGLVATGANEEMLAAALERAAADKSKEVREYAKKVAGSAARRKKTSS
jgi:HEAT repeat protein